LRSSISSPERASTFERSAPVKTMFGDAYPGTLPDDPWGEGSC
jgi:hypothetical protein